jgi:NADPH:quinone reductase-like Zn-dependent oxidoreductase
VKAVVQTRIDEPDLVLDLREVPDSQAHEVIVDVKLASAHHGDLFIIRSLRQMSDSEQSVRRGTEAYGVVRAVGGQVPPESGIKVGSRVAILASGAWSSALSLPWRAVIPIPSSPSAA